MLLKDKIQGVNFPATQYFPEKFPKHQIVLHHTASGRGTDGDFTHWLSNPERIATFCIIDYRGILFKCFDSEYWGHHLGIKQSFLNKHDVKLVNNEILNRQSVAIEIDSWGGLTKREDGKWYSYTGKPIAPERVQEYTEGYRGYYAFEKYTNEQIETVRELLLWLNVRYGIPLDYNEDMWDISNQAIRGIPGIFTHNSYREDKSDCHPQPELIKMLKELKPYPYDITKVNI